MGVKVSQIAFRHATDTNYRGRMDAQVLTSLAYTAITRAEDALANLVGTYTAFQLVSISSIFTAMRSTHHNIRAMLNEGENNPGSVDSLAFARIQIESLYAICLMLEGPDYVNMYMRDGWGKGYVQFLLQREETKDLARFHEFNTTAPQKLAMARDFVGVTAAQQATLDFEQLGTPLPAGVTETPIPQFPTPGKTIRKITIAERKHMLQRLYPEYTRLCSFAHVLPESMFFKTLFNRNHEIRNLISLSNIKDRFQQDIAEAGFIISFISMVQSAAELTTLYPTDLNLKAAAVEALTKLIDDSLLGRVIWEIRSRALLGIIA